MKKSNWRYLNYILLGGLALGPISNLWACTGILLKTQDQSPVYARTLEFGTDLQSQILFIPRNYEFKAVTNQPNIAGLAWNSQYAVIGLNAFGTLNYVDGVNEAGLAGGLFYFPAFAKYQDVDRTNYAKSIPMWQLLTWLLTNFKDISQIKQVLPQIYVTDVVFPEFKDRVPAHLILHDEAGHSLVIEYIDGKLHMHDNQLGVFTNAPGFDWHLVNLQNYINLSPVNIGTKALVNVDFKQLSQGSGLHGLPGDFTSPSRFVRAVQFVANAPASKTILEAVYQAFHILNNFDIPKGSVRDAQGHQEFTRWTSAIDLKNRILYFKNYANFQLQKIALNKMDLSSQQPRQFSMAHADQAWEVKIS